MLATQADIAESHLTAARSALRKGDIGQARDEVRLARFAAGENTAEISILRARIAVADGRDPSNDLGDSLRLDPNFAEALVFKGDLFLKAGNYKDARDSAIAALKAHPDFVAAHELLADIAVAEGNLGQAVTSLQDALNLVASGTDEFARLHDRLTSLQRCAAVELAIQSERNQPGFTIPRYLSTVQPVVTDEARRAKISGTVVLRVELRSDGTVGDVLVCKSLGYGLDEEAVRATRQLTFAPASKAGVPVTTWATVAVSYSQR